MRLQKARPLGELRRKAVRGHNVRSKTLSVTQACHLSQSERLFEISIFRWDNVVGEDSILPHNLLKYWDKIIGRLIASPTYFGGSKPPPYSCFFCNRKRTAIYFGGAFVVIFSPLRTTEIIRG